MVYGEALLTKEWEIIKALGIDLPNVTRVELILQAGSITEVNVTYLPKKIAMNKFIAQIKSYELVEKEATLNAKSGEIEVVHKEHYPTRLERDST